MKRINELLTHKYAYFIAVILGLLTGFSNNQLLMLIADNLSNVFISLLKLVSMPIIFLSIIAILSGMHNLTKAKHLSTKVLRYTLLTTFVAASIALLIFIVINPINQSIPISPDTTNTSMATKFEISDYLKKIIPSNPLEPFLEGNVVGVLVMAVLFSIAIINLPKSQKDNLHELFSSLYAATMKITSYIVNFMPVATWCFVSIIYQQINDVDKASNIMEYLVCILLANLIQAFIILPIFLAYHKVKAVKLLKAMWPAISLGFWSKSSSAALPVAIKCAKEKAKLKASVADFALPVCIMVNMNACAAFILTTVLFVSMNNGVHFSSLELLSWIFISTISAVGNAGVPMGCYFISSALLAYMNMPLHILGIILPFYALIDMLESAINLWSDACVSAVVDKKVSESDLHNL